MGLFRDRTKTYYASTSSLLYADMPPIIQQTAASSILQNRNIATDLVANLVNGVYWNANRLYSYGRDGGYHFGLPTGSMATLSPQSADYVRWAIEEEIGEPVIIDFLVLDTDPTTGHVLYKVNYFLVDSKGEATGALIYWEYDETTGTYPLLDIPTEDEHVDSPYYPIIPVRVNGVNQVDSSLAWAESVRIASRFIGVDVDEVNAAIEASTTDGYDPADDAYVMLGVEVSNDTQEGMEYMFKYFDFMHDLAQLKENSQPVQEDFTYWEANQPAETPPMNKVTLQDSNYHMELGWLYTLREVKAGVLTDEYESEYTRGSYQPTSDPNIDYYDGSLKLKRRINDTNYEEITVVGLVHSNWALGHELYTSLEDAFEDPDVAQSFIIPLRKDICDQMLTTKLHDLMYSSIRLVVNDEQKVELKWYQTGFFRVFTVIVSVCISIFYPPLGIAALSASAVGIAVTQVVVMKLLMPIAFKALEDLVGEELAILISVLALSYGADALYGTGGLTTGVAVGGSKALQLSATKSAAQYQAEMDAISESIEEEQELAEERQRDILFVSKATSGDPYAILQPQNHVKQFFYEHKEPMLIRDTTHNYTDMARFTDRPDSYIRLGHTGV